MSTSMLPSLLSFIVVMLMIPGALWLVKRVQTTRTGGDGPLAVVAGVSLGQRERIAIVRAGTRHLVLGVTSQSIALLAELDHCPPSPAISAVPSAFATFLRRNARNDQEQS